MSRPIDHTPTMPTSCAAAKAATSRASSTVKIWSAVSLMPSIGVMPTLPHSCALLSAG